MLGCDQVRSQVSTSAAMCERRHPCMDSFNVLIEERTCLGFLSSQTDSVLLGEKLHLRTD